jgi:hypothetical protein
VGGLVWNEPTVVGPLRVETVAEAIDNAGSGELIRGWNARREQQREAFVDEHAAHLEDRGLVLP